MDPDLRVIDAAQRVLRSLLALQGAKEALMSLKSKTDTTMTMNGGGGGALVYRRLSVFSPRRPLSASGTGGGGGKRAAEPEGRDAAEAGDHHWDLGGGGGSGHPTTTDLGSAQIWRVPPSSGSSSSWAADGGGGGGGGDVVDEGRYEGWLKRLTCALLSHCRDPTLRALGRWGVHVHLEHAQTFIQIQSERWGIFYANTILQPRSFDLNAR